MKSFLKIALLIIYNLTFIIYDSCAQTYPINLTSQLLPPFSGYLPDYAAAGTDKLRLLLLFNDFTKPAYNVKLKLKITGQGITIESKPQYYDGPYSVEPGVPMQLSGSDLTGLLNVNNLNFSGISQSQYEQRKVLPEGFYSFCITAYDYNNPNPIKVSNESCAYGMMVLSDPPYLNLPGCGASLPVLNPQQIIFNWTPINQASPNSAGQTDYALELFEVRPAGQNPNNIAQSLPPIFTETINTTSFNYGITEPPLITGMQYVWRVRAIDQSGRDAFKNQGYSQICTFTWGSQYTGANLAINLAGVPVSPKQLKCTWDSLNIYTNYKLEFKKIGGTPNWFPVNTANARTRITGLEPNTDYLLHVTGQLPDGSWGPQSNEITLHTPNPPIYNCGEVPPPINTQNFAPLTQAANYQLWDIGQFEVLVTGLDNYQSPTGQYTGKGRVVLGFAGAVSFPVTFNNITVSDEMRVVAGKVDVRSKGIDAWGKQYELTDVNYTYNGNVDSVKINSNGTITIYGSTGATNITPTTYPYVITDSNGDTWEIYSNGSVSQAHNTDYEDVSCINDSTLKYYIKVDSDSTKHYQNSTIFKLKNPLINTTFTLYELNGNSIIADSILWKIDGKKKCDKILQCIQSLSKHGDYNIVVYKKGKPIFKCKLIIYDSPITIFEKDNNYKGEYGFDDGFKYSQIAADYPIFELPFNNSFKSTQYIYLKPNQQVNLKFNITALKTKAMVDNNFKIYFGSTSAKIKINGKNQDSVVLSQLILNPNIQISSIKLDVTPSDAVEYVFALNSKKDTIGKIAISCYEVNSSKIRKLAIVLVKHNYLGFSNINKQAVVDYLNNNSHNQLHVKWELKNIDANYIDTLNISAEYNLNPTSIYFTKSTNILSNLSNLYQNKNQIQILQNLDIQYFFVTNFSNVTPQSGVGISGGINNIGGNYGAYFISPLNLNYVFAHELGHGLGLNHSFSNNGFRNITESSTSNFMDYSSTFFTWFRYQYLISLLKIQ